MARTDRETDHDDADADADDPLIRHGRREALAVAAIALAATAYTLAVCGWLGYDRAGEPVRFVLGFPDWVFWGIVVPWLACVAICLAVSGGLVADDDLGEQRGEPRDD